MENFRQDIIEALIFEGAQSFRQLAYDLGRAAAELLDELKEMKSEGLVRELSGQSIDAAESYVERWNIVAYSSHDYAHGPTGVKWVYCGGPISKALEVAA